MSETGTYAPLHETHRQVEEQLSAPSEEKQQVGASQPAAPQQEEKQQTEAPPPAPPVQAQEQVDEVDAHIIATHSRAAELASTGELGRGQIMGQLQREDNYAVVEMNAQKMTEDRLAEAREQAEAAKAQKEQEMQKELEHTK